MRWRRVPTSPRPHANDTSSANHHAQFPRRPSRRPERLLIALGALVLLVVLFAMFFDWNLFRPTLARIISEKTGRHTVIRGNLRVHLWSFEPSAEVDGLTIDNPPWAQHSVMFTADRLDREREPRDDCCVDRWWCRRSKWCVRPSISSATPRDAQAGSSEPRKATAEELAAREDSHHPPPAHRVRHDSRVRRHSQAEARRHAECVGRVRDRESRRIRAEVQRDRSTTSRSTRTCTAARSSISTRIILIS